MRWTSNVQEAAIAFFGGTTDLLFSLSAPALVFDACQAAAAGGVGTMLGDGYLQFHSSLVPELPAPLRLYLGCAERVFGGLEVADLIKIHIRSRRVSLMAFDGFETEPLPRLRERIRIELKKNDFRYYAYGTDEPERPLYFKSRYVPDDFPGYSEQAAFDRALGALGVMEENTHGPDLPMLLSRLSSRGLTIDGFKIRSTA